MKDFFSVNHYFNVFIFFLSFSYFFVFIFMFRSFFSLLFLLTFFHSIHSLLFYSVFYSLRFYWFSFIYFFLFYFSILFPDVIHSFSVLIFFFFFFFFFFVSFASFFHSSHLRRLSISVLIQIVHVVPLRKHQTLNPNWLIKRLYPLPMSSPSHHFSLPLFQFLSPSTSLFLPGKSFYEIKALKALITSAETSNGLNEKVRADWIWWLL